MNAQHTGMHCNGMDYKFVLHLGFSGYLCIDCNVHIHVCVSVLLRIQMI